MGSWECEVKTIKYFAFKNKDPLCWKFESVVLHHFEDFGKTGNLLMVLMFDIFLSKLFGCICRVFGNVGFQENIQVIDVKWDYNNLKRGDPPNL